MHMWGTRCKRQGETSEEGRQYFMINSYYDYFILRHNLEVGFKKDFWGASLRIGEIANRNEHGFKAI